MRILQENFNPLPGYSTPPMNLALLPGITTDGKEWKDGKLTMLIVCFCARGQMIVATTRRSYLGINHSLPHPLGAAMQ